MRRVATGVLLLGAATGGPYVILESPVGDQAAQMVGFTSVQDDEGGGEAPSSWASWWPAEESSSSRPGTSG